VTRVAVGDPATADIEVAGGGVLRVKALQAGGTTLLVWTSEGRKEFTLLIKD
jgi:Flp pilus assembly secretin CpaC